MTLRDFIPPVLAARFDGLAKSFAASAAAWKRGDDLGDGPVARLATPYSQSPWVFAAINLVSGEFAGLPVKFYGGETEYADKAFAAWWTAPALDHAGRPMSLAAVDRLLALHLQLHGEFFILLDDSWVVTAGRSPAGFSRFLIARPDRVRLIVQGGAVAGYVYTDPAGRQIPFVREQVLHHIEPNPYDDWRGIARADVARVATEGVFLTGVYIRDLMRNNGDQGYIVIGKNGVADDAQREQITASLRAKRAKLRAGQAHDLFLTGDISVDRPKEQAAGADLTATQSLSQQEIFIAFGVPPSMATVKQAYSIGKDSDRYQLITGRSQPLARDIASAYAAVASRQTGLALTAEHDWDDHPVMQEVRTARLDAGLKLWATGMAWKDVNDYLSLGLAPFPGWEVAYLPFSVVAVNGAEPPPPPTADPALAEDTTPKALRPEVAQVKALLALRARLPGDGPDKHRAGSSQQRCKASDIESEVLAGFVCGCSADEDCVAQKSARPPAEIARWREHMQARRAQVKGFESRFRAALFKARAETLANLDAAAAKSASALALNSQLSALNSKSAAADLVFNLASFTADLMGGMRKQHQLALNSAGQQVMAELGKSDPFQFAPHDVLSFISGRENKLAGVPDDVFGRIRATLQAGLDAGEATAKLAARVRAEFNAIDKARSLLIAQTETSAAYGFGRNEAMVKAGVQYKAWLTSGNDNVRSAHQEAGLNYPADGGIPLDQPFIVGGEALMYPGDPAGSPGNTIKCFCVQIAVKAPSAL